MYVDSKSLNVEEKINKIVGGKKSKIITRMECTKKSSSSELKDGVHFFEIENFIFFVLRRSPSFKRAALLVGGADHHPFQNKPSLEESCVICREGIPTENYNINSILKAEGAQQSRTFARFRKIPIHSTGVQCEVQLGSFPKFELHLTNTRYIIKFNLN